MRPIQVSERNQSKCEYETFFVASFITLFIFQESADQGGSHKCLQSRYHSHHNRVVQYLL